MKVYVFALVALLLVTVSAFSFSDMESASSTVMPMTVQSRTIEDNKMTIDFNIASPQWRALSELDESLEMAEYVSGGRLEEYGQPAVPVTGRMFRIPPRGGVSVRVVSSEYETLSDVDYAAYYGNPQNEEFGHLALNEDEWYPDRIASVSAPAILHDFRVCNLTTYPVQVNPARREVRVYSNIQVEINFEGYDDRAVLDHWPTKISENFVPWYRQMLDWNEDELDEYVLYRGNVQVVMRDDDVLRNFLEPWVEWKLQKGWKLDFLTEADVNSWNANNIQAELRERWEAAEEKFDYVVIIGDNSGIFSVPEGPNPIFDPPIGNCGDYFYSLMTEDDILQDVAVGRISVENTDHVNVYVNKVLAYERDPYLEETDWYKRGACLAVTHYSGISTILAGHYWRDEMLNLGYTEVNLEYGVDAGAPRSAVIPHLNDGVSIYHFRGGVGDGLDVNQISNLDNENKVFLALDVTCGTGDWNLGYGINEAYMRVGTVRTPKGGIGAMGTASHYTNTGRNNCLSGGLGFTILRMHRPSVGEGLFGAKMNLYNNYFTDAPNEFRGFSERFNLMGDPLVWIWTDIPQSLILEAENSLELGDNSYSVNVQDADGPVANAWVTLYKVDENEEVIARGVSDSNGDVTLNLPVRFEGTAKLTVTQQNYKPERMDVDIVSPESRVGYVDVAFQDDGEDNTVGNGNGIPEAGETVGLIVTAHNYGEQAQTNIQLSASSDDIWAENITGTASFGTINSGEEAASDDLILVEISSEGQNDWYMHLNFEFQTDAGTYTDDYPLLINAPQFALMSVNGLIGWEPGELATINLEVMNVGGSIAAAGTVTLESLDPFLSIADNEADMPATAINQINTSDILQIAMHPETVPGRQAKAQLILNTETGQVDTMALWIQLGTRSFDNPCGPDNYGYYAFDTADTSYDLCPEYEWVEISPAAQDNDYNGERLDITDGGNNADETLLIDLPFSIQYYGETFTQASVSSNGWVAMGDRSHFLNMRNFTIPSPLGPHYMIAPYWDEIRYTGNNCGVYSYHDQANGRFILEWYDVKNVNMTNSCTFQVIFYDQVEGHITYTGDTEFVFQYDHVQHTGGATAGHGSVPYWTTGIENGGQDDGILYAFWNHPAPGAVAVEDSLAIFFSTNVALITGTIEGRVTRMESEDPLAGMIVHTADWAFHCETDENGYYVLEEVVIGDHEVIAEGIGFNPVAAREIEVFEDQTTEVNFISDGTGENNYGGLPHPEFDISRDSILIRVHPDDEQLKQVTFSNAGNGQFEYEFKVLLREPAENLPGNEVIIPGNPEEVNNELDDPWEEYYSFDLIEEEDRNRGVTYMNEQFIVCGSNSGDGTGYNKLYIYDKDGNIFGSYDQPVENHSTAGFYGITNDGTYIYGADRGRLFQMEFDGGAFVARNTWTCPVRNLRYITYDIDRNWLWLGEDESDIYAFDIDEEEIVTQFPVPIEINGAGYFRDDPSGFGLYFFCGEEDENTVIMKMNPETGSFIEVITLENLDGLQYMGGDITNKYNPLLWIFFAVVDLPDQDIDIVKMLEININTRWIDINPMEGVINPASDATVDVTVITDYLPLGVYYAWLQITHNSIEQRYSLPMVIDVTDSVLTIEENDNSIPQEWAFKGAYPNPFNPSVSIGFTLKENTRVQAKMFNLLGQQVAEIVDQHMSAGTHVLNYDGSQLSSGMYFLKFQAGPLNHSEKLILMK